MNLHAVMAFREEQRTTRMQAEREIARGQNLALHMRHGNYHVRRKAWLKLGAHLPPAGTEQQALLGQLNLKLEQAMALRAGLANPNRTQAAPTHSEPTPALGNAASHKPAAAPVGAGTVCCTLPNASGTTGLQLAGAVHRVGQVWTDQDPRRAGRELTIQAFTDDGRAVCCETTHTGTTKTVKIALTRLHPTGNTKGYRLVGGT